MTDNPAAPARDRILEAARRTLSTDSTLSIEAVAKAAGISRATIHRHYPTRADLLSAAGVEPDPGSRERVLAAAAELLTRDGLAAMSIDEIATVAGVSRASVYRLFPGKPALFEALVVAYSPYERIIGFIDQAGDRPPEELIPQLFRLAAALIAPNIGILRSVLMEVSSGSPDAMQGAHRPLMAMIGAVGGYLERQMNAGQVVRMHPTIAVQTLVGPLFFHLLTRPMAARVGGLDLSIDESVEQLASVAVRGLLRPGRATNADTGVTR